MSICITPRCGVCNATEKVLRCQSCKVMYYCGQEHQIIDRPVHKQICGLIKKCQKNITCLQREMRAYPPDFDGLINIDGIVKQECIFLNDDVLVKELVKIKTFDAVEKALNHSMEVLRKHRINHLDLKYIVPVLLLRLNREQECYDFVKWYATTGQKKGYVWEDVQQPYLDVIDANYLEPVDIFVGEPLQLCHAVVVMLIKMRLLNNFKNLHNSMFLYERLPTEIADKIRKMLVTSTKITKINGFVCGEDQKRLIKTLEFELKQLHAAINSSNKYFWPGLLRPDAYLAAEVSPKHIYIDTTSNECEERAVLAVKIFHDCFDETPGAIYMVEELVQQDPKN